MNPDPCAVIPDHPSERPDLRAALIATLTATVKPSRGANAPTVYGSPYRTSRPSPQGSTPLTPLPNPNMFVTRHLLEEYT